MVYSLIGTTREDGGKESRAEEASAEGRSEARPAPRQPGTYIDLHPVALHMYGQRRLHRLLALITFELSFWNSKKERLTSLSVLSRRATK